MRKSSEAKTDQTRSKFLDRFVRLATFIFAQKLTQAPKPTFRNTDASERLVEIHAVINESANAPVFIKPLAR